MRNQSPTEPRSDTSVIESGDRLPRFYSPQLDSLRFFAALAVFIHHAPAVPFLGAIKQYGWLGVDLFLAISAFLITRLILLEDQQKGRFSLKNFYIRRILRIWPLYLGFVTAMCLLTIVLNRLPLSDVIAWWLAHLSFTGNVLTAIRGYDAQPLFTNHLWTISLEEQAYLILPLALGAYAARKPPLKMVLAIAASMLMALLVARLALSMADVPHPFVWVLPLRSDAFILGAVAAIILHHKSLIPKAWMMAIGLALICSSGFFPPVDRPGSYQVFGYTIVALGSVGLVIGSQAVGMERSPLAWPALRYLGKISFGLYVYHTLAIDLALGRAHAFGLSDASAVPFALLLNVGMAALSYALLEKPFLRLKQKYEAVSARPI